MPPRLIAVLGGLVLAAGRDMHGPPLLVGFVLGTLLRLGPTPSSA